MLTHLYCSPANCVQFTPRKLEKMNVSTVSPPPVSCLVVDDDLEIRTTVETLLRSFGIDASTAANATEMRQRMKACAFDVVVLDVMLPDGDGLQLIRWVLENSSAAIIMLTAQGDPASRVLGLEMGADDYMGKPFEPRELVARIRTVLRRGGVASNRRSDAPQVPFGGFVFDRLSRQLTSPAGVVTLLSSAEFRLLQAFLNHPRRILTRDQLIELTRAPGVEVNERSIDLCVCRLRLKLNDDARHPTIIRTVRSEGYVFDLEV